MSNGTMKILNQSNKTTEIYNGQTGEVEHTIITSDVHAVSKPMDEESFVKIYYNTFLASIGENKSKLTPFLMSIAKRMSFSTRGQQIILIKPVKEEIANEIGVSLSRVNHMIGEAKDLGLLISSGRGVYSVSPFIMAKGAWKEVRALQLTYNKQLQELNIDAPRPRYLQNHKNSDCILDGEMTFQELAEKYRNQQEGEKSNDVQQ